MAKQDNLTDIEKFIKELDKYIEVENKKSVSPAQRASGGKLPPEALIITPDLDVDNLTAEQLMYVHAMLHRFYQNKKNKVLTKEDIENLHRKVASKINHMKFDRLDDTIEV